MNAIDQFSIQYIIYYIINSSAVWSGSNGSESGTLLGILAL